MTKLWEEMEDERLEEQVLRHEMYARIWDGAASTYDDAPRSSRDTEFYDFGDAHQRKKGKLRKLERRTPRLLMHVPNSDRVGDTVPPAELYDERLHEMLSYARPHGSQAEADFVERFLMPYEPVRLADAAYVIQVTNEEGYSPPVMFSCHVDTVHWKVEGRQKVWFDPLKSEYFKKDGQPLGADDSAGMWLMLEMVDARIPGTYIFHRGEECGGIGSKAVAENYTPILQKFEVAIAFDRRGKTDVITHQGGERCCSDAFAQSLADALNANDLSMMYMPDDTGVYTDTKEYIDWIPECTNLSVGYDHEHSGFETLDVPHLFALREALLNVDWASLVVERDPRPIVSLGGELMGDIDLYRMTKREMEDFCYDNPEMFVALVRREMGFRD